MNHRPVLLALAVSIAALIAAPGAAGRATPDAGVSVGGGAGALAGAFGAKCAQVAAIMPSGATIEVAEAIEPAPAWLSPASPTSPAGEHVRAPLCRLSGTIDGDIGFEIWLPQDWNGRLLGAGVGGEAGYFNYADMARGVEQGFAAASSDAGHKRGEPWIADARKVETYSHLAYHRLTQVAKAVAERFYGDRPAFSYFVGCSGGGRQGLRELQLYPGDYDGALIGAPGLDVPLLAARLLHVHLAQQRVPGGELTAADWDLIAGSATRQCDGADGVVDGVIADPRACGFRVRQLECTAGNDQDCLSSAKVRVAEAIIAPLTDGDGRTFDYGLLAGNSARPGGLPPLPVQMFGDVVRADPTWDPRSFDIAVDLPAARAAFPAMDAANPDLSAFAGRGGKLLLYHGWADASVQPQSSITFFRALQPVSGTGPAVDGDGSDFARLYMVPGMQHCRGGSGTDRFGASEDRAPSGDPASDMLAALIAWVERGQAPGEILARRFDANGVTERSRPLCPFPLEARYRGRGNPDDAASFACVKPEPSTSTSNPMAGRKAASTTSPGSI